MKSETRGLDLKSTIRLSALRAARRAAALLRAECQRGRVHSVYPGAVYLAVGDQLLALTAQDVDRLPFGIQVPVTRQQDRRLLELQEGDPVVVGAGRLRLHSAVRLMEIEAGPLWDPRPSIAGLDWRPATVQARVDDLDRLLRPLPLGEVGRGRPWRPSPGEGTTDSIGETVPQGTRLSDELSERLRHGLAALVRAVRQGDEPAIERATLQLVGLGPGLTPSGDDVLGGFLAAGHFIARGFDADVERWVGIGAIVVAAASGRTTVIGQALLDCAAVGEVGEAVGALLKAVAARSSVLQPALERVLAIGHTSGADTALGALHGARLALALVSLASATVRHL